MTYASSSQPHTLLLATDSKHSILAELAGGRPNSVTYCTYGHQTAQQKVATHMGFNGEVRESSLGWYLLGNGYRAYNPVLMRFHSPDSLSPFGAGGLNAYMYCGGEPVMGSDPSGRFNPRKWWPNIKKTFKPRTTNSFPALETRPGTRPNEYLPLPRNSRAAAVPTSTVSLPSNTNSQTPPSVRENRRRGLPDGYEDYQVPPPRRYLKKESPLSQIVSAVASNARGPAGGSTTPAPSQNYSLPGSSRSRASVQAETSTYVVPPLAPRRLPDGSIRQYRVQITEDGNVTHSSYEKTDLSAIQKQIRRDPRG
ncbi:RHS repeat-associated core domain-containing protein [Pseudomonas sp. PB120]|uniref:RHS repeat-associated core domain-containing protein n=1 Tax=Pseudomonas sp. PB120 TaxID=2494700 RepID=UPI0012FD07DA|nr:RHS repeat-associated core domain-containing protein [Pseudomonas sp. PB120]MVV51439.1 RHS repeat-associated core domain-containing protein [Pseudomonas sp. PB120]